MPTVSAPSSRAIRATTGCRAGAGAASLARGDEHHVATAKRLPKLVVALLGGEPADLGIGSRAQPLGDRLADMELGGSVRDLELLRVGVDSEEVDLGDARVHHAVDRVDPGTADSHDADDREIRGNVTGDVEPRRAVGHRGDEAACGRLVRPPLDGLNLLGRRRREPDDRLDLGLVHRQVTRRRSGSARQRVAEQRP